jgi:multidrug efflux pump
VKNFCRFFIDRPIFAGVLSILIVIVGGIALTRLPIAQYPDIVPPTVQVRATYPGATAQVLAETVASPIEQEINGVENMLYLSSQSTNDGTMVLTVTFKLGTNLDDAQVQVQNRVAIATPRLPEEVRRQGVTVQKQSPDLSLVVNITSPDGSRDQLYLSNYASLQIKDVLARVHGVGSVMLFGARDYSMRIWLNPDEVSSRGLTANDVVAALREQNTQVAAGTLGRPPTPQGTLLQIPVTTLGRLKTVEDFENVVVRGGEAGRVTFLRDVARVELSARDFGMNSLLDGKPAVALPIFQLPGSNALETAELIRKEMEVLKGRFPPGVDYAIAYDTTVFVEQSIEAVVHTLFEAILLVVLVVLLFLQNWRTTLIPLLAVPVSIIGTFAVMLAFGFSLNTLTLFGLVLAIGIVVDDAIVVVENVERYMTQGLSPREAAYRAMDEVSGALIAIALVLSAVFVPTAFITGLSGEFYRQFALTIAVSTVISAFNSLTLSPALCALLLRHHGEKRDWFGRIVDGLLGWIFRLFNATFDKATGLYARGVRGVIRVAVIALIVYGGLLFLTWSGFKKVPTGFIPSQDMGYVIGVAQLPDGASLERTQAVVQRMSEIALKTPGVAHTVAFPGFSPLSGTNASNSAAMFMPLKPFGERPPAGKILAELNKEFSKIGEGMALVFPPPSLRGMGTVGGFKLMVQDKGGGTPKQLEAEVTNLIAEARKAPALAGLFSTYRAATPQLYLDIDRVKAKTMGVPLGNIFETLQIYLGSLYVNDFTLFNRNYQVTAQADPGARLTPEDILKLRTLTSSGEVVPLGTLMSFQNTAGPERVLRYNLYPTAEITGSPAPGFSTSQANDAIEKLAKEKLPSSFDTEWTEITLQEKLAGNSSVYIFPLCVLFVFLLLAALYESWGLPLAIVLIVPMVLLSAITGIWLRGMDNNIFTQIGFVVLVGLACKNAILIVEFAKQKQDEGRNRIEAAVEAARLRLRPILMTSMAFSLGVLPLAFGSGAGAEMRAVLGTAVLAGMIGVTFFGLFFTPVFYTVIRRFGRAGDTSLPSDSKWDHEAH